MRAGKEVLPPPKDRAKQGKKAKEVLPFAALLAEPQNLGGKPYEI